MCSGPHPLDYTKLRDKSHHPLDSTRKVFTVSEQEDDSPISKNISVKRNSMKTDDGLPHNSFETAVVEAMLPKTTKAPSISNEESSTEKQKRKKKKIKKTNNKI